MSSTGTTPRPRLPPRPRLEPGAARRPASGKHGPPGASAIDALVGDLDLGSDSDSAGGSSGSGETSSPSSSGATSASGSDESPGETDEGSGSSGTTAPSSDGSVLDDLERELGIDTETTRRRGKPRRRVRAIPVPTDHHRPRSAALTEEQERRLHIDSVLGDMRKETRTSFAVEHERVQDVKASKLEQIGQLRMTLEEEGVDCSGVGAPNMASPVDEIDSVLAILKLKNDRNRYSSMAEEVILGVAEGIETVFNGTREVPVVGWKPDYTGYHNTVNVKLHRMRFETSQVVGSIIERYKIGPATRIIMELLPSFFLYPRQQCKQRGSPGLYADFDGHLGQTGRGYQISRVADARGAYAAIRQADAPDPLVSLADI